MAILYLCNRKQCEFCHDVCRHTLDIKFSKNYKYTPSLEELFSDKFNRNYMDRSHIDYWEKEEKEMWCDKKDCVNNEDGQCSCSSNIMIDKNGVCDSIFVPKNESKEEK